MNSLPPTHGNPLGLQALMVAEVRGEFLLVIVTNLVRYGQCRYVAGATHHLPRGEKLIKKLSLPGAAFEAPAGTETAAM